jgi:shikimate dehydrogenase
MSPKAQKIGAVNTIKILPNGKLRGYNTDTYGFEMSIKPLLKPHHTHALILGTGGASKAITYALLNLNIAIDYVVRTPHPMAKFLYSDLTDDIIKSYPIIVNCTPVGTFPNVNNCPDIPYDGITKNHLLYDLIYNPIQTKFLICGEIKGAATCNGYDMLVHQAEKAWKIWQKA